MATPKGPQAGSTPKNPLALTPNRPTASPRPSAHSFANKTLSYKSPAAKTPGSLHGHSHRISISSHPISTPLAAPAIHDELLNLNSPAAALIASIGNTGLTPIAAGQEGLGINTGVTSQNIRDDPSLTRNPETERFNRLNRVVQLLKSRIAGRGVTREGVERIAQAQGFTTLWDEENLTIAGNSVDLEVIFDKFSRDGVRDVQLRLNASGSEEPQLQKDASLVLQKHLMAPGETTSSLKAWKSLQEFSQDLEYLSQLDYTDSPVNCFELMSDLYTAFRTIWDEEKKRMRNRTEVDHICQGNLGRPAIDEYNRLGIITQYWAKRQYNEAVALTREKYEGDSKESWLARFSCDKGSPGISKNRDWLENEPLKTSVTTEDVFQEFQIEKPNWSVPGSNRNMDDQQKDASAMMLDDPQNGIPDILNLVFTCHLENPIWVPINVTSEFNLQFPMLQIHQGKASTYQQALYTEFSPKNGQLWTPGTRWSKSVAFMDTHGHASFNLHSYSIFTNAVSWSYPVEEFKFSHPKHYADVLPILRQYALLWSIFRNTFTNIGRSDPAKPITSKVGDHKGKLERSAVKKRSNKHSLEDGLDDLLSTVIHVDRSSRIDVSLDLLTNMSRARVAIVMPTSNSAAVDQGSHFVHVNIDICRNGIIEVSSIRGPSNVDEDKLRQKAAKVLELSEDLSILIEWLRDYVNQKTQ